MAAGNWTFTDAGRTKLLDGTFDLNSDTFKMALFTSSTNLGAGSTTYAGVSNEVSNGNGYTTGGYSLGSLSLSGTTTVTVDCNDATWTASGSGFTARYAAIYEVGGDVLCYCSLDSSDITVGPGNTLTVQINASGVFTLN